MDGVGDATGPRPPTPLRVLQSFGRPGPRTNPYIVMLGDALDADPGLELLRFSWREALTGRYDVCHLHWPEVLMEGSTPLRSAGKRVAFALLLARLRLQGTPVVRTVHNLELPSDVTASERTLLTLAARMTTLRIDLNDRTPPSPGTPSVTIRHGDYRGWFARYAPRPPRPGHLAFVGLVRRYKGVEHLLDVFALTRDERPDLTLKGVRSAVVGCAGERGPRPRAPRPPDRGRSAVPIGR